MKDYEKFVQLFGDDDKPSAKLMSMYDIVCEILNRVMNIESSVLNRACICKCKNREERN